MTSKDIRVIIDTNVWISFLIGKKLSQLVNYILDHCDPNFFKKG